MAPHETRLSRRPRPWRCVSLPTASNMERRSPNCRESSRYRHESMAVHESEPGPCRSAADRMDGQASIRHVPQSPIPTRLAGCRLRIPRSRRDRPQDAGANRTAHRPCPRRSVGRTPVSRPSGQGIPGGNSRDALLISASELSMLSPDSVTWFSGVLC